MTATHDTFDHVGTCEYCDYENIVVTHYPRIGLNVCHDCQKLHGEALAAAESAQ